MLVDENEDGSVCGLHLRHLEGSLLDRSDSGRFVQLPVQMVGLTIVDLLVDSLESSSVLVIVGEEDEEEIASLGEETALSFPLAGEPCLSVGGVLESGLLVLSVVEGVVDVDDVNGVVVAEGDVGEGDVDALGLLGGVDDVVALDVVAVASGWVSGRSDVPAVHGGVVEEGWAGAVGVGDFEASVLEQESRVADAVSAGDELNLHSHVLSSHVVSQVREGTLQSGRKTKVSTESGPYTGGGRGPHPNPSFGKTHKGRPL